MLGNGFFIGGNGNNGSGGGTTDNVSWDNVENKPTAFPPVQHDHNNDYYRKTEIDTNHYNKSEIDTNHYNRAEIDTNINSLANSLYKVRTSETDEPSYLANKVDNVTLAVEGTELKVKSVDGLTVGITDISNWLSGTSENIQNQINGINSTLVGLTSGMNYIGKFETHADLQLVVNKQNGSLAVVLADENRSGGRSMYVYSETLGVWDFIGEFIFSDDFIELRDTPTSYTGANGKVVKVDEPNNKLVFSDVDYGDLKNKPTSTITQIDDAVNQKHEHSNKELLDTYTQTDADLTISVNNTHSHTNKPALDRFGIDENNTLTIDDVPLNIAPKHYLNAYRSGSNQTLNVNSYLSFNNLVRSRGIQYEPLDGTITLEAGKVYKIEATFSLGGFTTWAKFGLVRLSDNQNILPYSMVHASIASYSNASTGGLNLILDVQETGRYAIRVITTPSNEESFNLLVEESSLTIIEI